MANEYPDHAQINYQCAWSYDVLGLENEAIPYYGIAIALGLPPKDEKEAYIGLGSSLRKTGFYYKSAEVLQTALNKYNDNAIRAFLALSLYAAGENQKAVQLLMKLLLETTSDERINLYKIVLTYYSDTLPTL